MRRIDGFEEPEQIRCRYDEASGEIQFIIKATKDKWRSLVISKGKTPDISNLCRFLRRAVSSMEQGPKRARAYLRALNKASRNMPEPAKSIAQEYVKSHLQPTGSPRKIDREGARKVVSEIRAAVDKARDRADKAEKNAIAAGIPTKGAGDRRLAVILPSARDLVLQHRGAQNESMAQKLAGYMATRSARQVAAVRIASLLYEIPANTLRQYCPDTDKKAR
jgi:hypothetical protein